MIYIVTSGEYSDYGIRAVFSTREKAEAYIEAAKEAVASSNVYVKLDHIGVEEWELDDLAEAAPATIYCCLMNPNGEVTRQWTYEELLGKGKRYTYSNWASDGVTTSNSSVSAEHAQKLAAEARQAGLRKQALGGKL